MRGSTGSVPFTHFAVIYTNALLAGCFNCVLLYLIETTDTKIGSYSRLLSIMALFSMSYAVIHVLDAPFVVVDGCAIAFIPTGIFENNPHIGYPLNVAYCSFFSQSLILLMYHFVYRYIAVCRYHLMETLHHPKVFCLGIVIYISIPLFWTTLVVYTLTDETVKTLMTDVLWRRIGINTTTSGLFAFSFTHLHAEGPKLDPTSWIGAFLFYIIMAISFSIMSACALQICRKLRECHKMTSLNYHQLQMQLFRALIVQTVVPFLLEYCPCAIMFFAPMSGLPINVEYATLCISAYPVVEPLVVIFFVRDYRTALLKKLHLWKPVVIVASSITPLNTLSDSTKYDITRILHSFPNLWKYLHNDALTLFSGLSM